MISENMKNDLGGRSRKDKRFRLYSYSAIWLAFLFITVFFADIISTAMPAFRQTEIRTEVSFNAEAFENGSYAFSEEMSYLVSRSFIRQVPNMIKQDRTLLGTEKEMWVIAEAEVDQYMKGKPNRLRAKEKKIIDDLNAQGNIRLDFNTGFFTNGDSKLPEIAGIWSAAVGTIYVLIITLLICFPIGVMTAIYLEEYAADNKLMQFIEVNINNLAAVPSILYGLLGLAIFINFFGVPRSSPLVGGLTLSLMTLPVVIISTRAAIRAIPDSIREASLALGATRWQTITTCVLPLAMPGILTGTIIGLAQAIGETAPLLIVGMMAFIPEAPSEITSAATVMPAQIYTWSAESLRAFTERTAAGIITLLVIMLSMNGLAIYLRNKYEIKW